MNFLSCELAKTGEECIIFLSVHCCPGHGPAAESGKERPYSMKDVTPITADLLSQLEEGYEARPELGVMSNAISRTSLDNVAAVPAAQSRLRMDFSITVPTSKITNQKKSGRCWMFAGMNLLRERVIRNCNLEDFALSGTYLAFYDKLEKCNNFFEGVIHYAGQELEDRETFWLMHNPLPDGGQWDMFVSLVHKYGVVPDWVMPETEHSTNTQSFTPILSRKLREDGLELRELARAGKDTGPRRKEMLQEMYNALCILYGEPPKTFDFDYTDKEKKFHSNPGMTPRTFLDTFVKDDLDDYAVLVSTPLHPMGATLCEPYLGNVVEDDMLWLNVSQQELEDAALKQLKAGEAVDFSCDCRPDKDRERGYWDPDSFQYGEVLGGMKFNMDYGQRLASGESTMNHCMMLCGVNLTEDGTPNRWKIENSWGDKAGQKGYFVGSEKWFRTYVMQVIVRKEHLTEEQKKNMEKEPIPLKPWDPLA